LSADQAQIESALRPEGYGAPADGATRRGDEREAGSSIRNMQVATGTVIAGKLVVEGPDLPDGEAVIVLTREADEAVQVTPEEEEALLEAIAEADRGATVSAEELFARLDRIR
jgi:hypothetical protein